MNIFKRKQPEKESNIASTPNNKTPVETFSKKKFYFLLWNVISLSLYLIYIFYFIIKIAQGSFLSKLIVWLIYIYVIAFVLILAFSLHDKKKLKSRLNTYKSALKFFKYFIQIVTFVISIITAISSFIATGKFDMGALAYAILSLMLTVFMVLFEVIKIIIRKNIPTVKHNFLEMREKREEKLILLGKKKRKEKPEVYSEDEDKIRYDYGDEEETAVEKEEHDTPTLDKNFDSPAEPQKKQLFKNFVNKFKRNSIKTVSKINEGTDNYVEPTYDKDPPPITSPKKSPNSINTLASPQTQSDDDTTDDYLVDEDDASLDDFDDYLVEGVTDSSPKDVPLSRDVDSQKGFKNKVQNAFKKLFKK